MEMLTAAERAQLDELTEVERDVLRSAAAANHTRASLAQTLGISEIDLQHASGPLVARDLLCQPSAFYGNPGPNTVSSAMVVTDRGRRLADALSASQQQ